MAAQTPQPRRRRRAPRRKPKRKTRAEKITEKGRPVIATTTAPAPQDQQPALLPDDTGVFSTGPGATPAYHYHLDQATYPSQVNEQMAGQASEVSPV